MSEDSLPDMYLNNTWRANMSITGIDGLPPIKTAGNVLRASTTARLSIRLPPSCKPDVALEGLKKTLSTDVPYNCHLDIQSGMTGSGWCMKALDERMSGIVSKAGSDFFDGADTGTYGMGGSIPFLSELDKMYPEAYIFAIGLIGPKANAHGPNECMNLAFAKKLTCSLSHMLIDMTSTK